MKLNKFLAVAVAATVLPLSVASAAEVHEKPEFKGGVNPADAPVLQPSAPKAIVDEKGNLVAVTETLPAPTVEKPEFKGGVNGPGLVNDKAPYAEKGTPEVHEKPEFKLEDLKKSEKPTKPRRVLPKTSAAK